MHSSAKDRLGLKVDAERWKDWDMSAASYDSLRFGGTVSLPLVGRA